MVKNLLNLAAHLYRWVIFIYMGGLYLYSVIYLGGLYLYLYLFIEVGYIYIYIYL